MGKLGKRARKFAKKNLQSVMKKNRKSKIIFKRRSSKNRKIVAEDAGKHAKEQQKKEISGMSKTDDKLSNNLLDDLFAVDDEDYIEDFYDSDGYLSEDSECPYINEEELVEKDIENESALEGENRKFYLELADQKSKLANILKKDPKFSEFLESRKAELKSSRIEETYSDEEDDIDYQSEDESGEQNNKKILTSSTIDVWCWLVVEEPNGPALANLLNAFRTACRYGNDQDESPFKISDKDTFSKILSFVLCEMDGIIRNRLEISESCTEEKVMKLKTKPIWETVGPLVKSYLKSCINILNQVTDSKLLDFVLSRLKASVVFFAAFPSLIRRLIKISTHLWVTGEDSLSLSSFLIVRELANQLNLECFDTCLSKTFRTCIAHCKFVQPTNLKHIEFLMDSVVELYSLDIQKSYPKVIQSVQQLAIILQKAYKTKNEDVLRKIYSWQYINCINIWVKFIAHNIKEHDLRPLSSFLIDIISGVACLFTGPRYVPLRVKCVQMLNNLSSSTGIFIPISSLVFESLEHKGNDSLDMERGEAVNFASLLKVPKNLLKTRSFHEECIHSAVQLLLVHFSQWSYHISFPEVATIPLILLKRLCESIKLESLKRSVKRLIDQVEKNVGFIERKRDEVVYSPNDLTSVDSFLQLEKHGSDASFTKYYASLLQNARS